MTALIQNRKSPINSIDASSLTSGKLLSTNISGDIVTTEVGLSDGWIKGYDISYADTTTYSISIGQARDFSNTLDLKQTSVFTKTLSAWASGTGNGSLVDASLANSTQYYVYAISNGTLIDYAISTIDGDITTATNYPVTYTKYVKCAKFWTDSSGNIAIATIYSISNIASSLFPDYNSIITKSFTTSYVAEVNGWLNYRALISNAVGVTVLINDTIVMYHSGDSTANEWCGSFIPISKNSTYSVSAGVANASSFVKLIPCIGI